MYKIAVVGRGLIGSAATRHLAEESDGIVCIGPDEPQTRAGHDGVYASHYDEGRMTRHIDPMAEWSITASQSIARYRDLEARSGISFYEPSGYLGLGLPGSTYNARCAATAQAHGVAIERLDASALRRRFPYLSVPDEADGLVEMGDAGHISPRKMVAAQTRLAERAGATCIRQAARAIRPSGSGMEVELWDGTSVQAERVLITTGAFTEACGLSPVDLGLRVFGRTVVLVRIEGEAVEALRAMPTMIDTSIGAYILPPIPYADGHRYLKIGVGTDADPQFTTLGGLQEWFQGAGADADRKLFTARLKELFPVLQCATAWHTDTCAVSFTKTRLPIVDTVLDGRVTLAVGGCGKGAKGSDEWGRIAAGVVRGAPWSSSVSPEKLALA